MVGAVKLRRTWGTLLTILLNYPANLRWILRERIDTWDI